MLALDDIEMVAEAHDGEESLSLCEQAHPDAILVDMMMSGMAGTQAARAIPERDSMGSFYPQT